MDPQHLVAAEGRVSPEPVDGVPHSGLEPVGHLAWGQHLCHFYSTGDDLGATLVPYFQEGLRSEQACLWVASDPYPVERAREDLGAAVPDLDRRVADGQITLVSHGEWYRSADGKGGAEALLDWIRQREGNPRFRGMRVSGNVAHVPAHGWEGFMDYERAVSEALRRRHVVALCSYSSPHCSAEDVLDVVETHDFALARRRGTWEVIENASTKRTRAELAALNADLERRVAARTAELEATTERHRIAVDELNHRVNNTLATAHALVSQTLRAETDPATARERIGGRLGALARAHQLLTHDRLDGMSLEVVIHGQLAAFNGRCKRSGDLDVVVRPKTAVTLGMVLHELATNASKYGALSAPGGHVTVRADRAGNDLLLRWREAGGPAVAAEPKSGFGSRLIRMLLERDLSGSVDFRYPATGVEADLRIPLAGEP